MRLAVRTPARQATQVAGTDALRNLLSGEAPGTTTCPVVDDIETMLGLSQEPGGPRIAGYTDYTLARQPAYPLKDLAMFVGGDPLGPLATALTRQDGVSYATYELIVRGLPPKEDWRGPLRERIGQIQGTVNPEDLAAYEALVRKVESHGFDVVVRCVVRRRPTTPPCASCARCTTRCAPSAGRPVTPARACCEPAAVCPVAHQASTASRSRRRRPARRRCRPGSGQRSSARQSAPLPAPWGGWRWQGCCYNFRV